MNRNRTTELEKFLETKSFFGSSDRIRCSDIDRNIRGGAAQLPDPLAHFCTWLRSHWSSIDSAIIWGSFSRASERSRSFSLVNVDGAGFGELICGPSDIDALVIADEDIELPSLLADYEVLGEELGVVGYVRLDIFRDIIFLRRQGLEQELLRKEPVYLSYYLHAYAVGGHVLKLSGKTRRMFDSLCATFEFQELLRDHVRLKEAVLRERLQRGGGKWH